MGVGAQFIAPASQANSGYLGRNELRPYAHLASFLVFPLSFSSFEMYCPLWSPCGQVILCSALVQREQVAGP